MKWLAGPLARPVADEISKHLEQGDLPSFLVKATAFLVVVGLLSYAVDRVRKKRGWTGEKTKASLQRTGKNASRIANRVANFVAKVVITILVAAVVFYALWALVAFPLSGGFETSLGNIALMGLFLVVAIGGLWCLRKLWSKGPASGGSDGSDGSGRNDGERQ